MMIHMQENLPDQNRMCDTARPTLLTVGTCNRRAGTSVLIESFLKHHPDGRAFVCLVDNPHPEMPPLDLSAECFSADELSLPGGRRFLFKYDAYELCCALKPYALRYVFERFGPSAVLYLDSDILVTHAFWEDLMEAWETHSVLLTAHLLQLPTEWPLERQRLQVQHGAYNGGFVAVKSSEETSSFLRWWSQVLERHCTFDPMKNLFVDQRWLDLVGASCPGVKVLRDPGLNAAHWNLHERQLQSSGAEQWTVNGTPLKFFHFSAFDPERLSRNLECTDCNALILARHYSNLLKNAGQDYFERFPYGGDFYVDGSAITARERDLILGDVPELAGVDDPFALPTMHEALRTAKRLANTMSPLRLGVRYRDIYRATELIDRLYRHPILGRAWRLWCRLVNPSLHPYTTPHARH